MIPDDMIDEVAIEEVEDEREPTGFELDALLIERAAAEAADLEEERHNAFMDRVRSWARDDGDGGGIDIPFNLAGAGQDRIDEYFANVYRNARSTKCAPSEAGEETVAPLRPKKAPQEPTVRSAQGVRPLPLPRRPPPPELPPEPGFKMPIGTPGGFAARAARTPVCQPRVVYEYRREYRKDEDGRMRCTVRRYPKPPQYGPVDLPEMPVSDRWETR